MALEPIAANFLVADALKEFPKTLCAVDIRCAHRGLKFNAHLELRSLYDVAREERLRPDELSHKAQELSITRSGRRQVNRYEPAQVLQLRPKRTQLGEDLVKEAGNGVRGTRRR